MGIVNVTPDSFYAPSRVNTEDALKRIVTLRQQGADIIDLGAESSRPNAVPLTAEQEMERLSPVLAAVQRMGMTISVDTYHAKTAASALGMGAAIINDISAAQWDPLLLDVLVQYKPGYVLMHAQNAKHRMHDKWCDLNLRLFFEQRLNMLVRSGLPENRILLDPGIGFGKTQSQNLAVLRNIADLFCFGRPILLGISMKSFLTLFSDGEIDERVVPTQVITALLYAQGVFWHRVHDVQSTRRTLRLSANFVLK
ncbi:MAG: dihydropteroate synthase [Desulfovibrio sp.]|nr:dihydropteroate synthase [Desulfovibrio sp.]